MLDESMSQKSCVKQLKNDSIKSQARQLRKFGLVVVQHILITHT